MSTKLKLLPCLAVILTLLTLASGCTEKNSGGSSSADGPSDAVSGSEPSASGSEQPTSGEPKALASGPQVYEVNSQALLDAALSDDLLKEGWVNLFDGQSLFGWFIVGDANWRVEEGVLTVDRGEKSFLCTNFQLGDYELKIDFRSEAKTNSGVFLRSQPSPQDVALDCFELNIAPPDNPFPTGSFVQRKKLEPAELGKFDPTQWHTYSIRLEDEKATISLDGKKILEYTDDSELKTGHIALQHNEGRVEFKNIHLRPLTGQSLKLGNDWEEDWTVSKKDGAEFQVEPIEGGLKLVGGLGQVQSKGEWGNFILQASYRLAKPEVNSGIFFRCVREGMLDGYECQLNHAMLENDPLRPADAGAGAIFRRENARIVMGDGTKTSYVTILATGPSLRTWINGVQMVDFNDTRPADDNPRKGTRTAAGPIALQGHDPATEAVFESLRMTVVD